MVISYQNNLCSFRIDSGLTLIFQLEYPDCEKTGLGAPRLHKNTFRDDLIHLIALVSLSDSQRMKQKKYWTLLNKVGAHERTRMMDHIHKHQINLQLVEK